MLGQAASGKLSKLMISLSFFLNVFHHKAAFNQGNFIHFWGCGRQSIPSI